jgi:hypothetical protein
MPNFLGEALSLVELLNIVGGSILLLVLGPKAWADKPGRKYRLCAGALAVGLMLGSWIFRYDRRRIFVYAKPCD